MSVESVRQIEELEKIANTLEPLDFPTRFAVEVCADCNLECTMCHHPLMRRPKGVMPLELWKKCADQVVENSSTTHCWFSFCGEPLLEPDLLIKMVQYAKSIGLRSLNINTNGILMNPKIADGLLESGIDLIVFGIDGYTRETYQQVRVGGDRDRLYENVVHFLERRDVLGSCTEVQVQFIEMESNRHEFKNFKSYWIERGAIVKVRKMLSWGGTFENGLKVPQEYRIPCPWAMTMMHVFWDGRVPRCPGDIEGEESVGNAWDESLESLWRKLDVYRQKHLDKEFEKLPERCHNCKDWMVGVADRIRPNQEKVQN